jgi:hypothetical protein
MLQLSQLQVCYFPLTMKLLQYGNGEYSHALDVLAPSSALCATCMKLFISVWLVVEKSGNNSGVYY